MRNIDSITAPVTAPPSDIHQPHHPMAQHATSHFISKIIITGGAYHGGMDPKQKRQRVGTFSSGISLLFRFIFPLSAAHVEAAGADLFRKTQSLSVFCDEAPFVGLERRAVTITPRCHPSRWQFVQPVWSLWLTANELWVIHATEAKTEHAVWMWAPPRVPHYTQTARQT